MSWMDDIPTDEEERTQRSRRMKAMAGLIVVPLVIAGYWTVRSNLAAPPPPPPMSTYTELVPEIDTARMEGEELVLVAGRDWKALHDGDKLEKLLLVLDATGSQHYKRLEVRGVDGRVSLWVDNLGDIGGVDFHRKR
jgi:hypothetical protein